jgi:YidC/Oxa1 family membrane protein insertase
VWSGFVDLIRVAIFGASHVFGGSIGGGILLVSFAVRLGLLPWTIRIARRAFEQQQRMAALAPELQRMQQRWAKDPAKLMAATQALYAANGIRMLDPRSLFAAIAQWPLFAGLFSAVRGGLGAKMRFLWIADLGSPSVALTLAVAAVAGVAASIAPAPSATQNMSAWALVAAATTLLVVWSMSSALALSIGTGSVVSLLQNWLLRRELRGRSLV